ncbi:MAG: hypothetical protein J7497_10980, partial [Chitinophagaceae bacterium]|nr:hypothetical protein [Chitinophagaceae bacterium]
MDLYLFSKVVDKYLAGTATENEQKLVEAYWERFSSQNEISLTENEKELIRLKIHEGVWKGLGDKALVIP